MLSELQDKRRFVENELSSLLIAINSGYYGARYEVDIYNREFVYLLSKQGDTVRKVNVTADSKYAICLDVFKAF